MRPSVLPVGNIPQVPIGNLPFSIGRYDVRVPHKIQDKDPAPQVTAYFEAITARRRERLNGLIREIGGQVKAIERLGKGQSLLSQLSTGRKDIGESLARDIEHAAGKPFGWLDWDSEEEKRSAKHLPTDPLLRELLSLWPDLSVGDRRELIGRAAGWLQRREDIDALHAHRRA